MLEAKITKAIKDLVGFKNLYNIGDFNVIFTAILGSSPEFKEVKLLFDFNSEIDMNTLMKFFKEKIGYSWDPELYVLELFQNLDTKGNFYISKQDIVKAWKEVKCKIPLEILLNCFDNLAEGGVIDYFTFKNMYLTK